MLAHYARVRDLALAYKLSALVAHIALNMVEADFKTLKIPDVMSVWANLIEAFESSKNRAFAYAVICANSTRWNEGANTDDWLDNALKNSGLPSKKDLLDNSRAFLIGNTVDNLGPDLKRSLCHQLDVGITLFDTRLKDPAVTPLSVSNNPTPPLFDREGRIFGITQDVLKASEYNPEFMHDMENRLDKWTVNFLSGCR